MKYKSLVLVSALLLVSAIGFVIATVGTPDGDGDGVPDLEDSCNNTPTDQPVDIDGCSIQQICATSVKNHGAYVSCVARDSKELIITPGEHGLIVSEAAQSDIGMPNVE
jgi:hypothetical protein